MATGYVYVLKSRLAPIYKIGKAAEHRKDIRLRELDVGSKNDLIGCYRLYNYHQAEKDCHTHLKEYRIPQSEYFALPEPELNKLVRILESGNFNGYEIENKDTQYGYVRITPYPSHVTLEDEEGECVAIDESVLMQVIEKMKALHDSHYLEVNADY